MKLLKAFFAEITAALAEQKQAEAEFSRGVAANVLRRQGVDLKKVRVTVGEYVPRGPEVKVLKPIPFTPRVKMVLVTAQKEAGALNHTYVGTEHVLLGLLAES